MGPRASNWSVIRPFSRVGKLNKTLTIPAFSTRCGLNNLSLYTGESDVMAGAGALTLDISTAFTYEAWIKCYSRPVGTYRFIVGYGSNAGNDTYSCIRLNGQYLECQVFIATVETLVTSTTLLPQNEWVHVAATFDNTAITLSLYINGQLDLAQAVVGPIDNVLLFNSLHLLRNYAVAPNGDYFRGSFGMASVRNICLTAEQVAYQYNKVRNTIAADTIDDDVIAYWTIIPLYIKEWVSSTNTPCTGLLYPTSEIIKDFYELKYGGSFIPILFTVVADVEHSLKFPIERPTGTNFGLQVSWLDDSGILQRRKLFDPESGSIDQSPNIADYNGEKLPLTYTLEVWNKDGYESVDMTSALTFDTSILTNPTFSTDHAKVVLATPAQRTLLYEPFPLTGFPLAFDNAQTNWI